MDNSWKEIETLARLRESLHEFATSAESEFANELSDGTFELQVQEFWDIFFELKKESRECYCSRCGRGGNNV